MKNFIEQPILLKEWSQSVRKGPGWMKNDNFEIEWNKFFFKRLKIGCYQKMNERIEEKPNTPISRVNPFQNRTTAINVFLIAKLKWRR